MSADKVQQGMPVIIRGGSKSGIIQKAIEIQANGVFQVTQPFQAQQNEWIQSDSGFSISYIESLMIGEMGENLQFCQTSSMAHPLTYRFKDDKGTNIFTISEVADGGNYSLLIAVDLPNNYFQIVPTAEMESKPGSWSNSVFDTADAQVYSVEVTDANSVPVCQFIRANEEDIYLNLEPPV